MGFYEREVVPRILNRVSDIPELRELRSRVAQGLAGEIVEIGFGSGLNLPHLPATVTRLLAVDPSETARRLAQDRVAAAPMAVEFIGLDGQHLPLGDGSVDAALSTLTLCTVPDVARALAELQRVLRPGGRLHFLEHGLSPDPPVAKWQRWLTPLQRRLVAGCHFDRPIDRLITDAGFEIETLRNYYLKGMKTPGYMYEGLARSPAPVVL